MDRELALIVLTAFLNLALSNFLFYRYQKKIEDNFSKQLYEYQIKFSRKLPKTLEVLEMFYQKFEDSNNALAELSNDIFDLTWNPNGKTSISESKLNFLSKFKEAQQYFSYNRIFMSEDSIEKVSKVLETAFFLFNLVSVIPDDGHKHLKSTVFYIKQRIKDTNSEIETSGDENDDDIDYPYFVGNIYSEYSKLPRIIEKHYKIILDQ